MMTCYFIIIFIVYLLNKSHHSLTVAKVSDENLELKMFLLHLFDQVAEKCFHLFDEFSELRCASVRIFINNVIQFSPLHFLAGFVEKTALVSVIDALFTYETRLLAVWINTKNGALVAINALRMFFNLARHCVLGKIWVIKRK